MPGAIFRAMGKIDTVSTFFLDTITFPFAGRFTFYCKQLNIFQICLKQGLYSIVKQCLNKGVNPNFVLDSHETALTMCLENTHFQLTKLLVENGADPSWINPITGDSYLHHDNVLHIRNFIDLFMRYNLDINLKNKDGETPLLKLLKDNIYAREVVGSYLRYEADPTFVNNEGFSGLHYLFKYSHTKEIIDLWWSQLEYKKE